MSELVIEARGLEKRFGPIPALAGIDLTVPRGASLALLGPNGAGKTTLLRLLAGLSQPSRGWLRVGDARERRAHRARIGFVGHASGLYPTLTVIENLLFAGRMYAVPEPEHRARALLEAQGLAAVSERPAAACSRGMAQRLSIARSLMHDPEILLLDEPFSGLDRPAAERLAAQLQALRAAGRTLVLVTHDLERAVSLADAALVLARGSAIHYAEGPSLSLPALEQAYARAAEELR